MPTKKPRIQVTLSDEAHRIVTRLAELQRSHRSRVVSEIINDLAPVLGDLLGTLEAASRIREENIRGVRESSLEVLEAVQRNVDEATNQFSMLDVLVRRGAEEPPTSNTGVTHPPKRLKSLKSTTSKKGSAK